MTETALYPVFKQPDYDPTILSDDEANALLTEDFSMAPEEWD